MKEKIIKILAIESSCDETAAALIKLKAQSSKVKTLEILSNIISSQVKLHAKYGGVYPELASREHVRNMLPVIAEAIMQGNVEENRLSSYEARIVNRQTSDVSGIDRRKTMDDFDIIAVTTGPGLIGSLLPGVNTAKTLAYIYGKPIYAINHVEGHIYANFIGENPKSEARNPKLNSCFPLVALVVSGGHTSLVCMKDHLNYKVIGETLDDAAGEAFDKVAAMLGLGYPGGPVISVYAEKAISYQPSAISNSKLETESCKLKAVSSIKFPRPMLNSGDFDFSFSGLKTSVLYTVKKLGKKIDKKTKAIICKEFQDAVIDVLVSKTIAAAKKYKAKSVLLCGGVSANDQLRKSLQLAACDLNLNFSVPPKNLCTDNAAMIGIAAAYKIALGKKPDNWYDVNADANQNFNK